MKPIHQLALACLLAAISLTKTSASPITTLYNTGVDASGAVLPDGTVGDPHYTLTSIPVTSTTPFASTGTLIRTAAGGFPIGPYNGDDSLSRWIGPNNDNQLDGYPGDYTYQTTFSLAGFQAATASINGLVASDNDLVNIFLNGTPLSITTPFAGFGSFTAFGIGSGFVSGNNVLDFVVHNGGAAPGNDDLGAYGINPTALRVEMTGSAQVPDGGQTMALLGLGFTAISLLRRKLR